MNQMMKLHKLAYMLLGAAAILTAAVSCKDDDEDTTVKPSLYGVWFDVPEFARIGDEVTVSPSGAYAAAQYADKLGEVGYFIKINSRGRDTLTTVNAKGNYTYTFKLDTLKTYTIQCGAFADGFYETSTTAYIQVLDPGFQKSLRRTGIFLGDDSIIDPRGSSVEENTYFYTTAGGLEWFRNNLAYTGSGICYKDCEVTSYIFGRYYTYDEALAACPAGWRLPTDAEWEALGNKAGDFISDAYLGDIKMWEYWPEMDMNNSLNLCVIPAGYATITGINNFKGLYDYAAFWTATEDPDNASNALYRAIYKQNPSVQKGSASKTSFAASVRCVR